MLLNFAGSDPGQPNYAYAITAIDMDKFDIQIIETGMFLVYINNLTEKSVKPPKSKRRKRIVVPNYDPFSVQMIKYIDEWEDIVDTYNPEKITSERFQARGLRGKTIEIVSMMNAFTCKIAQDHDVEFEIITAATWKNQVNRYIDLKHLYTQCSIPPHVIDSVLISIHGAVTYVEEDWSIVNIDRVANQLKALEYIK